MANRKELPREKRLKERINQLEEDIVLLMAKNENQESTINSLTRQLSDSQDFSDRKEKHYLAKLKEVGEENQKYEAENQRQGKMLRFLIDNLLH